VAVGGGNGRWLATIVATETEPPKIGSSDTNLEKGEKRNMLLITIMIITFSTPVFVTITFS